VRIVRGEIGFIMEDYKTLVRKMIEDEV